MKVSCVGKSSLVRLHFNITVEEFSLFLSVNWFWRVKICHVRLFKRYLTFLLNLICFFPCQCGWLYLTVSHQLAPLNQNWTWSTGATLANLCVRWELTPCVYLCRKYTCTFSHAYSPSFSQAHHTYTICKRAGKHSTSWIWAHCWMRCPRYY